MRDNLDELRHIEGFPIGEDEDLHALSYPPYYTAYPNPHIAEFIEKYGELYDEAIDNYQCQPYVSDVSEGKNDSIYNAHTYHTKVPYKAVIPFINHYTKPGDIILDGFCGTGMVGVASQALKRRAILIDLSTAATFIAYNYNFPESNEKNDRLITRILSHTQEECGWLYETVHIDGKKGKINYVVWSEIFSCPYCNHDVIFWDSAVDEINSKILDKLECKYCNAFLSKRDLVRIKDKVFDPIINKDIYQMRKIPVLIKYSVGKERYEKLPDDFDLKLIAKIEASKIPYWYPINKLPSGDKMGEPSRVGITHLHHFYSKRNLWALACLVDNIKKVDSRFLVYALSVAAGLVSKLTRYNLGKRGNGPVSGTLYVPSLNAETNLFNVINNKKRNLSNMAKYASSGFCLISSQSTTDLSNITKNSVDYIFTDPPFGANLMYSELNFIWESWLKIHTNNGEEAIINRTQKKSLSDYRNLMTQCFREMFSILKPGRWITVEFHNSKASVWNAIQEALAHAGFIVAQVTIIDKKQGSFNQVSATGAVKNDLVINAYKPRTRFTKKFVTEAGRGLEATFVRQHLFQLPITADLERSREMLFSKYLAYYVQHGYQVAYNSEQFYRALSQWGFIERDGYWFADENQVNEYERRKAEILTKQIKGRRKISLAQSVLFISDERSARQWLWNILVEEKSFSDIHTEFLKALQTPEDQIPELQTLLAEGFIRTDGNWKRPDSLTQAELEKRRHDRLLRQFDEYFQAARTGQHLKEVRKEAVVAGFTEAYRENRFQDILAVGKKLPRRLVEESPDLFDFIDIAEAKLEL